MTKLQPCGSWAAHKRHMKAHEPPCTACRQASRERSREYYERRGQALYNASKRPSGRPGQALTFVQGALVSGASSHVLDRLLASPDVRRLIQSLPPWLRGELEATARAIRKAASEYEALPAVSLERSDETGFGETVSPSAAMGWDAELSTGEAASFLGVSVRRAQQLAAGGMGRKVGGTWRFDPASVRSYMDRRSDDAGAA